MGDFKAFAKSCKKNGMFSHDVASSHGQDSYLAGLAFTDQAIPTGDVDRRVLRAGRFYRLPESECGAARSVLLPLVMEFQDLDVVVGSEGRCSALHESKHEVDADAHVGR